MPSNLDGNVTDQNGVPVAGALVYVYDQPGGLAELTDALGQPAENPVVAGEDGYWSAYAENDRYYTLKFSWGGRIRYVEANVLLGESALGIQTDANVRSDLQTPNGAGLLGTASGRTMATVLAGLSGVFVSPAVSFTSGFNNGDSFSVQPSPHFSGDSTIKRVFDHFGLAFNNSATSGHTSADAQTGIFVSGGGLRAVPSTGTHLETLLLGQNDAIHLGSTAEALRRDRIATLSRIQLANMLWKGLPASAKAVARATSSGTRTVSGSWTADPDVAGAFKASGSGAAQQEAFTNARGFIAFYKVKVGSSGIAYIREERDEVNVTRFRAQPEATGWIPTNTSQDWAIEARFYDAGQVMPELLAQFVVDPDTGGGDVSFIGFAKFTGDIGADYPVLGVGDVSRWTEAAYATQGNGITTNIGVVNETIRGNAGYAARLGLNVVSLPFSSAIGPSFGLHTDGLHPSAAGADASADLFIDQLESGAPFARDSLDALVQALIAGRGGDDRPGAVLHLDDRMRMVRSRIGGSSLDLPATDNVIPMSTSGVYLAPKTGAGIAELTKALLLLADGNHGFVRSQLGDLVLGNAGTNRLRVKNNSLDPENDEAYSLGSSDSQFAAVWSLILNLKPITFANLAAVQGNLSIISDSSSSTPGAVAAGGGVNEVLVRRTGAGTWIVVG